MKIDVIQVSLLLQAVVLYSMTDASELNKKIPVNDNDPKLLISVKLSPISSQYPAITSSKSLREIVYRMVVKYTQSKIPSKETNWWIPMKEKQFHATKIRAYNEETKTYYASYNIFPVNARSNCSTSKVPISSLKTCTLCNIFFSWTENDWKSSQIEGTCVMENVGNSQYKKGSNH
uniref:Secreted protein n=1 Tax=Syphacia muris TaxID=451379 RepID=A0A0N5ATY5_9BILA